MLVLIPNIFWYFLWNKYIKLITSFTIFTTDSNRFRNGPILLSHVLHLTPAKTVAVENPNISIENVKEYSAEDAETPILKFEARNLININVPQA